MSNMNSKSKQKMAVTIPAAIALVILYIIIFRFSDQDGETSSSISQDISRQCVELGDTVTGSTWSAELKESLSLVWEHPIRKLAHFSEYAIMGALLYLLFDQWMKRGLRMYGLIVLWVVVSAAADEFHQFFLPGRMCSPVDVCIDTLGAVTALLLCAGINKLLKKLTKPK